MSMHRITDKVSFGYQSCRSDNLQNRGAVRTEDNNIYFVFVCKDCGEDVTIDVEKVIASLCSATPVKGNERVQ